VTRFEPTEISARVERVVAGAGASPWLVGYDANGIQELITASGRPISMRGASEVILAFDKRVRDEELTIFAGGGRGVLLARSEGEADAKAKELVARYRVTTCGGIMAACAVPLERGRDAQARSIRWLRHRLGIEKDAAPPPTGVLPDSKASECAYCRNYRGTRDRKRDDEIEKVCPRCDAMLEHGRRAGDDDEQPSRSREMSLSIEKVADRGRIAVIAADGNNLGALFDSLHNLVELAAVSEVVATTFQNAQERALECVPADKRVPLMSGGDDICAFLPPGAVLSYVEALVEVIESSASEYCHRIAPLISPATATRLDNLGVGIGAVVANVYYPAWRLVEYARVLEHNAKAPCYEHGWRSGFDFAVVTTEDSMTGDVAHIRSADDIRPLRPRSPDWETVFRNARALARIPSAQLAVLAADHAIRNPEAAGNARPRKTDERQTMSDAEFANVLRYQVARSPAWQDWYKTCGVEWRVPDNVFKHRPTRGLLDLTRLLAHHEART